MGWIPAEGRISETCHSRNALAKRINNRWGELYWWEALLIFVRTPCHDDEGAREGTDRPMGMRSIVKKATFGKYVYQFIPQSWRWNSSSHPCHQFENRVSLKIGKRYGKRASTRGGLKRIRGLKVFWWYFLVQFWLGLWNYFGNWNEKYVSGVEACLGNLEFECCDKHWGAIGRLYFELVEFGASNRFFTNKRVEVE